MMTTYDLNNCMDELHERVEAWNSDPGKKQKIHEETIMAMEQGLINSLEKAKEMEDDPLEPFVGVYPLKLTQKEYDMILKKEMVDWYDDIEEILDKYDLLKEDLPPMKDSFDSEELKKIPYPVYLDKNNPKWEEPARRVFQGNDSDKKLLRAYRNGALVTEACKYKPIYVGKELENVRLTLQWVSRPVAKFMEPLKKVASDDDIDKYQSLLYSKPASQPKNLGERYSIEITTHPIDILFRNTFEHNKDCCETLSGDNAQFIENMFSDIAHKNATVYLRDKSATDILGNPNAPKGMQDLLWGYKYCKRNGEFYEHSEAGYKIVKEDRVYAGNDAEAILMTKKLRELLCNSSAAIQNNWHQYYVNDPNCVVIPPYDMSGRWSDVFFEQPGNSRGECGNDIYSKPHYKSPCYKSFKIDELSVNDFKEYLSDGQYDDKIINNFYELIQSGSLMTEENKTLLTEKVIKLCQNDPVKYCQALITQLQQIEIADQSFSIQYLGCEQLSQIVSMVIENLPILDDNAENKDYNINSAEYIEYYLYRLVRFLIEMIKYFQTDDYMLVNDLDSVYNIEGLYQNFKINITKITNAKYKYPRMEYGITTRNRNNIFVEFFSYFLIKLSFRIDDLKFMYCIYKNFQRLMDSTFMRKIMWDEITKGMFANIYNSDTLELFKKFFQIKVENCRMPNHEIDTVKLDFQVAEWAGRNKTLITLYYIFIDLYDWWSDKHCTYKKSQEVNKAIVFLYEKYKNAIWQVADERNLSLAIDHNFLLSKFLNGISIILSLDSEINESATEIFSDSIENLKIVMGNNSISYDALFIEDQFRREYINNVREAIKTLQYFARQLYLTQGFKDDNSFYAQRLADIFKIVTQYFKDDLIKLSDYSSLNNDQYENYSDNVMANIISLLYKYQWPNVPSTTFYEFLADIQDEFKSEHNTQYKNRLIFWVLAQFPGGSTYRNENKYIKHLKFLLDIINNSETFRINNYKNYANIYSRIIIHEINESDYTDEDKVEIKKMMWNDITFGYEGLEYSEQVRALVADWDMYWGVEAFKLDFSYIQDILIEFLSDYTDKTFQQKVADLILSLFTMDLEYKWIDKDKIFYWMFNSPIQSLSSITSMSSDYITKYKSVKSVLFKSQNYNKESMICVLKFLKAGSLAFKSIVRLATNGIGREEYTSEVALNTYITPMSKLVYNILIEFIKNQDDRLPEEAFKELTKIAKNHKTAIVKFYVLQEDEVIEYDVYKAYFGKQSKYYTGLIDLCIKKMQSNKVFHLLDILSLIAAIMCDQDELSFFYYSDYVEGKKANVFDPMDITFGGIKSAPVMGMLFDLIENIKKVPLNIKVYTNIWISQSLLISAMLRNFIDKEHRRADPKILNLLTNYYKENIGDKFERKAVTYILSSSHQYFAKNLLKYVSPRGLINIVSTDYQDLVYIGYDSRHKFNIRSLLYTIVEEMDIFREKFVDDESNQKKFGELIFRQIRELDLSNEEGELGLAEVNLDISNPRYMHNLSVEMNIIIIIFSKLVIKRDRSTKIEYLDRNMKREYERGIELEEIYQTNRNNDLYTETEFYKIMSQESSLSSKSKEIDELVIKQEKYKIKPYIYEEIDKKLMDFISSLFKTYINNDDQLAESDRLIHSLTEISSLYKAYKSSNGNYKSKLSDFEYLTSSLYIRKQYIDLILFCLEALLNTCREKNTMSESAIKRSVESLFVLTLYHDKLPIQKSDLLDELSKSLRILFELRCDYESIYDMVVYYIADMFYIYTTGLDYLRYDDKNKYHNTFSKNTDFYNPADKDRFEIVLSKLLTYLDFDHYWPIVVQKIIPTIRETEFSLDICGLKNRLLQSECPQIIKATGELIHKNDSIDDQKINLKPLLNVVIDKNYYSILCQWGPEVYFDIIDDDQLKILSDLPLDKSGNKKRKIIAHSFRNNSSLWHTHKNLSNDIISSYVAESFKVFGMDYILYPDKFDHPIGLNEIIALATLTEINAVDHYQLKDQIEESLPAVNDSDFCKIAHSTIANVIINILESSDRYKEVCLVDQPEPTVDQPEPIVSHSEPIAEKRVKPKKQLQKKRKSKRAIKKVVSNPVGKVIDSKGKTKILYQINGKYYIKRDKND